MNGFQTTMQGTVRVPQEGFTADELKAHLRSVKIPVDARLRPTLVRDVMPGAPDEDGTRDRPEVGFIAEWTA